MDVVARLTARDFQASIRNGRTIQKGDGLISQSKLILEPFGEYVFPAAVTAQSFATIETSIDRIYATMNNIEGRG
jgi:hypothetical protein